MQQAKVQTQHELDALVAEQDEIVKEIEYWNEAIRIAAPKIKPNSPDANLLKQLADWHEDLRIAENRLTIVNAKLTLLKSQALTSNDVATALDSFEPVWESLTVREQSRIVKLIVKQVDYDGANGRVTITFHPDGIKSIARSNKPELAEAAS